MKKHFLIIKLNCKPLIKAYLENNFGDPVELPTDHVLYKLACSQLVKENARVNRHKDYSHYTNLSICAENFRYDGYSISETNAKTFNSGVDNFMRVSWRNSLDGLLRAQNKHIDWKKRYFDLLKYTLDAAHTNQLAKEIKRLRSELESFDFDMKTAIEEVVFDFLKLDFDVLPYETVKKDYYRYRQRKLTRQVSLN